MRLIRSFLVVSIFLAGSFAFPYGSVPVGDGYFDRQMEDLVDAQVHDIMVRSSICINSASIGPVCLPSPLQYLSTMNTWAGDDRSPCYSIPFVNPYYFRFCNPMQRVELLKNFKQNDIQKTGADEEGSDPAHEDRTQTVIPHSIENEMAREPMRKEEPIIQMEKVLEVVSNPVRNPLMESDVSATMRNPVHGLNVYKIDEPKRKAEEGNKKFWKALDFAKMKKMVGPWKPDFDKVTYNDDSDILTNII